MDKLSPEVESTADIWKQVGQHIAYYGLWLLNSALSFWIIFLLRTNLVEDLLFLRINPWQLRALDRWFIYAMGIVWIVWIFWLEGYLRRSVQSGRLLITAARLLLVQFGLIVFSFAIHYI